MASSQTTFKFAMSLVQDGKHLLSWQHRQAEDKDQPFKAMLDIKQMIALFDFSADKATAKTDEPVALTFANKGKKMSLHVVQLLSDTKKPQCGSCGILRPEKNDWCVECQGGTVDAGGSETSKVLAQL